MRAKETRDGSIVDARDGSIKEKGGGISSLLIDGSVGERSCGAAGSETPQPDSPAQE